MQNKKFQLFIYISLKQYKKSLLQQLFPAEGETTPQFRFPEFQNAPAWKKQKLGKIFAERKLKKHPEKPVLASTQDRGVIFSHLLAKSIIRDEKNLQGYKVVLSGDFVISLRSFEGGFEYANYEGIISPAYVILFAKLNICHDFFKYYFKSYFFILAIQGALNNSLRDGKSISYSQASEIQMLIPEIEEQKKIAACLASLDELISTQSQKIELLRKHKKGLMQQLFPSAREDA